MKKWIYGKLGIRIWDSQKFIGMIILVQLIVLFFLSIGCICIFRQKYPQYAGMNRLLTQKGIVIYSFGLDDENGLPVQKKEDIVKLTDGRTAYSCYNVWATVQKEKLNLDFEIRAYDENILEAYKPYMEEGKWLNDKNNKKSKSTKNEMMIQGVVSENEYGIQIGDVLKIYDRMDSTAEPVQVKITGIIEKNGYIPGYEISDSEQTDYTSMMQNGNQEYRQTPLLILNKEELDDTNTEVITQAYDLSWIVCRNDREQQKCEKWVMKQDTVKMLGTFVKIKENNRAFFRQEMIQILPVFLCVFLMSVMTQISAGAIISKNMQYSYGVYRLCGMRWKDCMYVQMMGFAYLIDIAWGITVLFSLWIERMQIFSRTVIRLDVFSILGTIILGIMDLFLVSIIPTKLWIEKNICVSLRGGSYGE